MTLFIDIATHCAPAVPAELLAAIATVESGLDPLSLRARNGLEAVASAGAGVSALVGQLDAGQDVAIGLMGLDARSLGGEGLSYADAFDACRNLEAAGRIVDQLWKAAERMGLSPSKAERHAVRAYFARSLARLGTAEAYEALVMAHKQRLQNELPRLALKGPAVSGPGLLDRNRAEGTRQSRTVALEGAPRKAAAAIDAAVPAPAWDVYGRVRPAGMVVFSKK